MYTWTSKNVASLIIVASLNIVASLIITWVATKVNE